LALFAVEQHLLNGAVSLRSAERRLGDGQIRAEVRAILESLQETVELTQRAKRIMLHEWRLAEERRSAA
jgi:hypothetical protein